MITCNDFLYLKLNYWVCSKYLLCWYHKKSVNTVSTNHLWNSNWYNACITRSCKCYSKIKALTRSVFFFISSFLLQRLDCVKIQIWNTLYSWYPVDRGWTVIVKAWLWENNTVCSLVFQDLTLGVLVNTYLVGGAHQVKAYFINFHFLLIVPFITDIFLRFFFPQITPKKQSWSTPSWWKIW